MQIATLELTLFELNTFRGPETDNPIDIKGQSYFVTLHWSISR